MRVFIDACIDPRVAEGFAGHEVKTAVEMGWRYLILFPRIDDMILAPLIHQG